MNKQNRTRDLQLIVRVSSKEKEHINKKMEQYGTTNFNAYARKMLIDGYVIEVDLSMYHELANEVNKVGVNVNQIAKIANQTGSIHPSEITKIKELINEIWQLLKLSLSELQSTSR